MRGGYKSKKMLFFIILLFVIIQIVTIIGMAGDTDNSGDDTKPPEGTEPGNTGTDTTETSNTGDSTPDDTKPENTVANLDGDPSNANHIEGDTSVSEKPERKVLLITFVEPTLEKSTLFTEIVTPLSDEFLIGSVGSDSIANEEGVKLDHKRAYTITFATITEPPRTNCRSSS